MVDLIVSALADLIAGALEAFIGAVMPLFGFSFTSFISVFPFAAKAYEVLQDFALGLALILAAWSLIPFIFNMNQAKSSPVRTLLFTVLAVAGIYYGNYVLEWIIDIADAPYQAILELNSTSFLGNEYVGTAGMDDGAGALVTAVTDAFMQQSVLLYIILLLMVAIAFVKLLLEAVERYVVLFVIVYLSPLAFATMASESSFGVFKKFFSMFISQCIMLILTIWSVEMGISMLSNISYAPGGSVVGLLMGYAFLRIAGRLDSYLNQLGLNTAVTGLGIGNELMATGMMLMSKGGKMSGGAGGSGGSGSSGGIVGAANRISSGLKKISPIQPAVNKAAAGIKSVAGAGAAGVKAWANKVGTGGSLAAGTKAAAASLKSGLAKNMRNAKLTNQGNNLWSRGLYSKIRGAVDPKKLTNSERANHAYFADRAFNSAAAGGAANNDPAAVASTAAGIGIGQADPEGKDLVNVGLGNTDAENVNFALDKDGVHANYDANGLHHDWDIKSADQFAALSPEQQNAYTGFKSSNGQQYYYKHSTSRLPTQYQKDQMAASARFASVLGNSDAVVTPEIRQHMNRTPGSVGQYHSAISEGKVPSNQVSGVVGSIKNVPHDLKSATDQILANPEDAVMTKTGDLYRTEYTDAQGNPGVFYCSPNAIPDYENTPVTMQDGSQWFAHNHDYSEDIVERIRIPSSDAPVDRSEWNAFSKMSSSIREETLVRASETLAGSDRALTDDEAAPYLRATIQSLSNTAISNADRSFCINALDQGQATDLRFDGSGGSFSIANPDNGHIRSFSVRTNLPSSGDEAEKSYNEGYRSSVIGDRNWGFKTTERDRDGNVVTGRGKK